MSSTQNANGGIGSYAGIQFNVLAIRVTGGRRTKTHEFYASEKAHTEDTGRTPRRFAIEAVIVGDDYVRRRESLIKALEKKGAATLAYPLFDNVQVRTDGTFVVNETTGALRSANFSMQFVEDFGPQITAATVPAGQVTKATAVVDAAAVGEAESAFSVVGAIQSGVDATINAVQHGASALRKINGRVKSVLGVVADVTQGIDAIANGAATLIATPAVLVSEMQAVVTSIFRAIDTIETSARASIDALTQSGPSAVNRQTARLKIKTYTILAQDVELYGDTTRPLVHHATYGFFADSSSNEQVATNIRQTALMLKTAFAKELVASATVTDFRYAQEVQGYQQDVVALLDDILADCGDELYRTIANLKASFVSYCVELQRTLPYARVVTTTALASSVALAHEYYGSIDYEPDISAGNNLPNPAAVPAGTQLLIIGQ